MNSGSCAQINVARYRIFLLYGSMFVVVNALAAPNTDGTDLLHMSTKVTTVREDMAHEYYWLSDTRVLIQMPQTTHNAIFDVATKKFTLPTKDQEKFADKQVEKLLKIKTDFILWRGGRAAQPPIPLPLWAGKSVRFNEVAL